jgi:hypothetical protein
VKEAEFKLSWKLTVAPGQLTDAEKKAKKKAKKAAQKVQEDPKKAATSANEDKGLEAPAPKDDDPDGAKLLASPDGLEAAAKFLQPLVNLELPSNQLWVTVYDVAVRRSKLYYTCITSIFSQKPQRDTYRQSKPFCMPPPLILQTQKCTYVW